MKPGEERTPQETIARIQEDLRLATQPRKGATIERNQQRTGVIDSLAKTVIDGLVAQGKTMYELKDESGVRVYSNADIESTLERARAECLQCGDFINSLLFKPGVSRSLEYYPAVI